MNNFENSITQVIESYKAAVFDRNVDAFVRLYADDVRVFDTWGVWSYEGIMAWRKVIEAWFGSLGTERVMVQMNDVRVTEGRGFAVVSAIGTYAAISTDGELRSMQNRLSWALKSNDSAWKIVHEHTSAPINSDKLAAILHRDSE